MSRRSAHSPAPRNGRQDALTLTRDVRQPTVSSGGTDTSLSSDRWESTREWHQAQPASESHALAAIATSPGEPIDAGIAESVGKRLGFSFSNIRIHADPAAAASAQSFGARAYAYGDHLVFGRGAYRPHTAQGAALVAHELAHVAQQRSGSTASPELAERQADAVEAGGSFTFARAGAQRSALYLRPGGATSLDLVLGRGGASITAQVEGGATVSGSGSASAIEPGEYLWVHAEGSAFGKIEELNGTSAGNIRFDVPDRKSVV